MEGVDQNPFANPFEDGSVQQANTGAATAGLEDYNPFAENNATTIQAEQSSVMQSQQPPPAFENYGGFNNTEKKEPVSDQPTAPVIPGHEELIRRQEELDKKAEELQRREQQLQNGQYAPQKNNWPPFPAWFPINPCFFQDFSVDIPSEFQRVVKMLYYLWMYWCFALFFNVITALSMFASKKTDGTANTGGELFGLSLLWWVMFTPCSLCWYRPVYKAFRSDSSFNFFFFFFVMFFQSCWATVMAVGPGVGSVGWITAFANGSTHNAGVTALMYFNAIFLSVMAAASVVLLKRVHTLYRRTGASFEKAQQEFATGVMKNPGVQSATKQVASAAVQSQFASNNP